MQAGNKMVFHRPSEVAPVGARPVRVGRRPIGTAIAMVAGLAIVASASFSMPVAAASGAAPQNDFGSTTVTTETLAGADQYATAIAVSQSVSPAGHVPVVYLVSGTAPGGALAAGPAAARNGGVVLLTGSTSLPSAVADELVRLVPAKVRIVGGAAAVTDAVLDQVVALLDPSTVVERVAGADAYSAAASLSAETFSANTGATFHPIAPGRVLDSRISHGATQFHSRVKQSFAVGGLVGVPMDAIAVTGNVTVVGQTQSGYVTVAPLLTSGVAPTTSTINFPVRDTRANGLTVALGVAGKLDAMYWGTSTSGTAHLVFDVTGYFANDTSGATFHPTTPGRVLDSRLNLGGGLFHSQVKQSVAVGGLAGVPTNAVAVTGNVTVTGQTQSGFATVAPSLASGTKPSTSTINFPVRDTRANGITVSLGAGGRLSFIYWSASPSNTANIIFDVTGYFSGDASGASFHPIYPRRDLDSRVSLGATIFHTKVKQAVAISGVSGVPGDALAVTGNVTVVGQTQAGFVTVAPSLASGTKPSTSTINFPVRDTRANGLTVSLGASGKLAFMYWTPAPATTVQIVFDVTGYFANDPPSGPSHTSSAVIVASGENQLDALVAGSGAAMVNVPFLLVGSATLPAATAAELARLRPSRVIIIGSTTSVADSVLAKINLLTPKIERVSGSDNYGTARAVAARYFSAARTVIATSGLTSQNALTSVPLSLARGAPILYVQDTDLLPVGTRDELISVRPSHEILVGPINTLNQAELVGFADGRLTKPTETATYPAYDSGYHDPGELYTVIKATEIAYPNLVHVFSIGKSYQHRDIWAAKVSSDVATESGKPEMMVDALHHANEHLGVEQALYFLNTLTSQYDSDAVVHRLVNERVTWIVFAVNPDGWAYDLSGGKYQNWRKNRQPSTTTSDTGTDINRNYSYKWGCCGGSSASPWAWNFRGPSAFSTPEARAIRDFVNSRVINGVQMIKTQLSLHTSGGLILYPYGYTNTVLPSDMYADDHAVLVKMASDMAALDGYQPRPSSGLYVTDGDEVDWLYHSYRIMAFTIELYPTSDTEAAYAAAPQAASGSDATVGPDPAAIYLRYSEAVGQIARNRGMLLYVLDNTACPYALIGKSAQYCPAP